MAAGFFCLKTEKITHIAVTIKKKSNSLKTPNSPCNLQIHLSSLPSQITVISHSVILTAIIVSRNDNRAPIETYPTPLQNNPASKISPWKKNTLVRSHALEYVVRILQFGTRIGSLAVFILHDTGKYTRRHSTKDTRETGASAKIA